MPRLFAGTSGFAYPAWKPGFYPAKLPAARFLEHYAQRLNSVEINYTFRRLPTAKTLEAWVNSTPPEFSFALKAPMRITHIQRLQDAAASTELFLKVIDPLRTAKRLGPILFQLPPQLRCDAERLASYLTLLPPDLRFAFEFRHASWLDDSVYELLAKHNVSLCLAESDKLEIPRVATADFVYNRLRKADYAVEDRAEIRDRARQLLEQAKDVYVYFKHEETPEGALYAQELLAAV